MPNKIGPSPLEKAWMYFYRLQKIKEYTGNYPYVDLDTHLQHTKTVVQRCEITPLALEAVVNFERANQLMLEAIAMAFGCTAKDLSCAPPQDEVEWSSHE